MSRKLTPESEATLAAEIYRELSAIVDGAYPPHDARLQRWAHDRFVMLREADAHDPQLNAAMVDSLVDILSCDAASWDTPVSAFWEGLKKLERLCPNLAHHEECERLYGDGKSL